MSVIGGRNEPFNPQTLLSFQNAIGKIPSEKLSTYLINKTKSGDYSLEKQGWTDKKIHVLGKNKEKYVAEIVDLTIDGFNQNVHADYSKIVSAVSKLPGFQHVDDETKKIFENLGELWIAKQEKLSVMSFLRVTENFEAATTRIENFPKDPNSFKFVQMAISTINKLEPPANLPGWEHLTSYHKEALQNERDKVVAATLLRLNDFPNCPVERINKITKAIEELDKRFKTSEKDGQLNKLQSATQKTVAILYSAVFDSVNIFLENPWQEAVSLSQNIKAFQDYSGMLSEVIEAKKFKEKLQTEVAPLLQTPIDPVPVSIPHNSFTSSKPIDKALLKEGEKISELIAIWEPLFPDFTAAVKTFGRGNCFDKVDVYINGEKIAIDPFLKKFQEQYPEIAAEKSSTNKAQMAKTVFLCEQLFIAAKERMPDVTDGDLKRAIAETLVSSAIDYNPIGLPTFVAPDLSAFGVLEGHLMAPLKQKHQFSFSQEGANVSSSTLTSQGYNFSDMSNFPSKTVSQLEYISKLTKNFGSDERDWKGTLESKEIV